LAPSSYYYKATKIDETELEIAIEEIAGQFPTYGTRRVAKQLGRSPHEMTVNRKRARRIMLQKGLFRPVKRRKRRTTNSQHPYPRYPNLVKELKIVRPDQVWVSDITYIRLLGDFVYLAIIMDVFTRAIRGWCLSRSMDQELTLTALRNALSTHVPEIHHSDQGVQYAANDYTGLLQSCGIQISMAAIGKAEENGYAERVIRTIKEEEIDLSEYLDFADAARQIGYFIEDVYRSKRIHSSLGYLTPSEYEQAYRLAHTQTVGFSGWLDSLTYPFFRFFVLNGLWKSGQHALCCPLFHRLYFFYDVFLHLFFPPLTLLLIGRFLRRFNLLRDFVLPFLDVLNSIQPLKISILCPYSRIIGSRGFKNDTVCHRNLKFC